jgi:DNA-binding GntR family transcriptional regulator
VSRKPAPKSAGGSRPRRGNLAAQTADRLREKILAGELVPGQSLREVGLCRELGVSRNPLREALHRLEGEGLVQHRPNRGAVVAALSPADVHEIVEVCRLLETHLLRLAVPALDSADLDAAEKLLDSMDEVCEASAWAELNWRFHVQLYSAARKPLILGLADGLRRRVEREIVASVGSEKVRQTFNLEHRKIFQKVRGRRATLAAELLDAHLRTGRDEAVKVLGQET